jgi:hypothetical protein
MRCTSCGKEFPIKAYLDELDEETWEKIALRPSNRARPCWFLPLDGGGLVGWMSTNAGYFTLPLVPSHRREGR